MPDSNFTPLRQHLANVLADYKEGVTDGLDDAVQAIFDHPEFAAAWEAWLKTKPPAHGEQREIGQRPMWWDARDQMWMWEPVKA